MLGAMKDLKSFISVRDFMEKMGTNTTMKKKTRLNQGNAEVSVKEQYENARGGYYL
jgi:hypothetical protein